jgi:hypothetical protein
MKNVGHLLSVVLFACLAVSGCTNSTAIEEPHLEKVHALLEQGDSNDYPEACRYLQNLTENTRIAVAQQLLLDENPLVVYLGGSLLVRQKRYDEAASVMAQLIVNGRDDRDLLNHMEFDWRHDPDPATWANMMSRVGHTLIVGMGSYQPESRIRAEQFLVEMLHLEVNKPFNQEDAVTAILKLSRGLKQVKS